MKAKQRRIYKFDTRSVMLFAALSLGGAGVMNAQAQTSSSSPTFGPAGKTTSSAAPPALSSAPSAPTNAAPSPFDYADANKDGQLSANEASQLLDISQRFKQLDTDKNGTLSRSEFDKGARY